MPPQKVQHQLCSTVYTTVRFSYHLSISRSTSTSCWVSSLWHRNLVSRQCNTLPSLCQYFSASRKSLSISGRASRRARILCRQYRPLQLRRWAFTTFNVSAVVNTKRHAERKNTHKVKATRQHNAMPSDTLCQLFKVEQKILPLRILIHRRSWYIFFFI